MAHIKTIETDRLDWLLSDGLWSSVVRIWAATCVSVCASGKASLIAQACVDLVYIGLLVKTWHRSERQTDNGSCCYHGDRLLTQPCLVDMKAGCTYSTES